MMESTEFFESNVLAKKLQIRSFALFSAGKKISILQIPIAKSLKPIACHSAGFAPAKKKILLDSDKVFSYDTRQFYGRWCVPHQPVCRYELANEASASDYKPVYSLEINLVRAEKFGTLFAAENMAKLARCRLFQRLNYATQNCHIYSHAKHKEWLAFSQRPAAGLSFYYDVSDDYLSCGAFRPVTEGVALEVICSRVRFYADHNLDDCMAQLNQLLEAILPSVQLDFSIGSGAAAVAATEDKNLDEHSVIKRVWMRKRAEIEKDLQEQKKMGGDGWPVAETKLEPMLLDDLIAELAEIDEPEHLAQDIQQEDRHGDLAFICQAKARRNFLVNDLVFPQLDFANFQGVIKVPLAKNPECPVEREIQREMAARYQQIKSITE